MDIFSGKTCKMDSCKSPFYTFYQRRYSYGSRINMLIMLIVTNITILTRDNKITLYYLSVCVFRQKRQNDKAFGSDTQKITT